MTDHPTIPAPEFRDDNARRRRERPPEADSDCRLCGRPIARAWAWDRAHASALQARPEDHGIAGAFVGMVHTHAHARPWPSTLDWRRPRAQDVFAIFHLGSGRVTFFRRGTTARQAALCGSVVIRYDASSWIRVSHGEAGDPSEAARRCGPVTSEVAL